MRARAVGRLLLPHGVLSGVSAAASPDADQAPRQTGARFSAKARAPS
ncbi:MAG: hypothetical protein JWR66_3234, partial [Modestobacter sp.]|nr:hypothetical protein [Modestobacter sp.]